MPMYSDFQDAECPSGQTLCDVQVPSLVPHGRHRFEARAVGPTGRVEGIPKSHEWEIKHCNDPTPHKTDAYARIGKNGELECVDCPSPVGSNCKNSGITWEGVYANPGWWTPGFRNDTYYKCPFRWSCLGGLIDTNRTKNETHLNGTKMIKYAIKSRCKKGFTGVVCAVCSPGYYRMDNNCFKCLPSDGGAEVVVAMTMCAAFITFLSALLVQLRVRDSKAYWKELQKYTLRGEHKKNSDAEKNTMRSKKLQEEEDEAEAFAGTMVDTAKYMRDQNLGRSMKTFIGFIQILSVSDSAFNIPWPTGFLSFLNFLVPFNFDFLSVSGIGCLVKYDFFASHVGMAVLPLVVLFIVYATYKINLLRQQKAMGTKFSAAMHTTYTNHAIQFTLWSILLIYPPLSRRMVEYFAYSYDIEGHRYLVKDYNVKCFEGEWNKLLPLAILAVLVYPLGIPFYFSAQLWKRKDQLRNPHVVARYGFLYEAFRHKHYLWDVFELLRKFFLTGLIMLIYPGETFQVIVVVLANLLFLVYILLERPHKPGSGRTLAQVTYLAICVTMLLGLILDSVESAQNYPLFFDVLLLGINGSIVAYTFYVVLRPVLLVASQTDKKKIILKHTSSVLWGPTKRSTTVVPVVEEHALKKKANDAWAIEENDNVSENSDIEPEEADDTATKKEYSL